MAQESDRKGSILTAAHPCFVTSSKLCGPSAPPVLGNGANPIRVWIKGVIKKKETTCESSWLSAARTPTRGFLHHRARQPDLSFPICSGDAGAVA